MLSQNTGKLFIAAAVALSFMLSSESVWAQAAQYKRDENKRAKTEKPGQSDAGKKEKVDITDLEKKYWAPKDTDFSVVQNRTYTKAERFSVSLLSGPVVNDTFTKGLNLGVSVNYFFDERMGVELSYINGSSLTDSDTVVEFRNLSGGGTSPDYGRPKGLLGASFNWVPFYAKMSVLGKQIIYFDMIISPGLGITNYDRFANTGTTSKSAISYTLDITQMFFLSKNIAIRADVRNRWYSESVVAYTGGAEIKDIFRNRMLFLLGVTYYH